MLTHNGHWRVRLPAPFFGAHFFVPIILSSLKRRRQQVTIITITRFCVSVDSTVKDMDDYL
jgi:hypothetical protein